MMAKILDTQTTFEQSKATTMKSARAMENTRKWPRIQWRKSTPHQMLHNDLNGNPTISNSMDSEDVEVELVAVADNVDKPSRRKPWFGLQHQRRSERRNTNKEKMEIFRTLTHSTSTLSTNSSFSVEDDRDAIKVVYSRDSQEDHEESTSQYSSLNGDQIELVLGETRDVDLSSHHENNNTVLLSKSEGGSKVVGADEIRFLPLNRVSTGFSLVKRYGQRTGASATSSPESLESIEKSSLSDNSECSSVSDSCSVDEMELEDFLDMIEVLGSVRLEVSPAAEGDSFQDSYLDFDLEEMLDKMAITESSRPKSISATDQPIPNEIFVPCGNNQ